MQQRTLRSLLGLVCLMPGLVFATPTNKPVDVFVGKAEVYKVPLTIDAVGHMKAIRSVSLSFDTDGRLVKLYAHDGERVKSGQVIAQLDAEADEAQLTSLKSAYDVAKSKYQRFEKLKQYGGVSAQVLEQAKSDMVTAQASMKKQTVLIAQKTLTAPFAGALGSFQYSDGAYLDKGTALVTLVQQAPLKARYTIPASLRSQIEIGQAVSVQTESYPGKNFDGIVNYTSPDVNRQSGTLTIEAKLANDDYLLSPGMFVSVTQVINPDRKLLMVPDIAIMTNINGQYVYLVHGDIVKQIYVKVGEVKNGMAQIIEGLKEGQEVVTAGQQRLNDADAIRIIKTQIMHPDFSLGHIQPKQSKAQSWEEAGHGQLNKTK